MNRGLIFLLFTLFITDANATVTVEPGRENCSPYLLYSGHKIHFNEVVGDYTRQIGAGVYVNRKAYAHYIFTIDRYGVGTWTPTTPCWEERIIYVLEDGENPEVCEDDKVREAIDGYEWDYSSVKSILRDNAKRRHGGGGVKGCNDVGGPPGWAVSTASPGWAATSALVPDAGEPVIVEYTAEQVTDPDAVLAFWGGAEPKTAYPLFDVRLGDLEIGKTYKWEYVPPVSYANTEAFLQYVIYSGLADNTVFVSFPMKNIEEPIPALSCTGFDDPVGINPVLVRGGRTVPFKAMLQDESLQYIDDTLIASPPAIEITYSANSVPGAEELVDTDYNGAGTEGNLFEYIDGQWQFNVSTKAYTAPGIYVVKMTSSLQSGEGAYRVEPTCTGSFVIE